MRTITICFTKSKKKIPLFSWIIRLIWNTEYSHTAMIFHSNKYNRKLVYHASSVGINFSSEQVFYDVNELVYSRDIEVEDKIYDEIIVEAIDMCGRKYGVLQAIGVGISYLAHKLGYPKENPFSDGQSKWVCSEWVAVVLSKIYTDYNPDLETVSPKEVYDFVQKIPTQGS